MEIIAHPKVKSKSIVETSGLVFYHNRVWLHNDSGGKAELFSRDVDGQNHQKHTIEVNKAVDWEDLSIDRKKGVFYIADTGDNREKRTNIQIITYDLLQQKTQRIPISYDTGPIDVEGIAFDPIQQELILISKGRGGTVHLFSFDPQKKPLTPLRSQYQFSISAAKSLNPERITAMDISPDGSYIAIRNYMELFLWQRSIHESVIESMQSKPCVYMLPIQKQGESLGFSNNHQMWTLSEGKNQPLFEIRLIDTQP